MIFFSRKQKLTFDKWYVIEDFKLFISMILICELYDESLFSHNDSKIKALTYVSW